MSLQYKSLFACMAGVVAASATWLLVDASGLAASSFLYRGDNLVGGQAAGYFLYQFTFAILLSVMLAAADGVFRETNGQRRGEYWIALGCGLAGGMIGPAVGMGCAALFPASDALPDGASGVYLLDVFLMSLGWSVAGAAAGAVPGLARKSLWIAERGALGGALGTLAGATLFQLTTSIFDQSEEYGSACRLGSLILAAALSALGATLLPALTRPVWLKGILKSGRSREYIVGRSPFRIGKDPACDIVIVDNSAIAPVHIVIEAIPQTKRHRLRHAARSPAGRQLYAPTRLNEEIMTSEKWLSNGDTIRLADLIFEFHETGPRIETPATRLPDHPLAENLPWPGAAKTMAIPQSMLPVAEVAGAATEGTISPYPAPWKGDGGESAIAASGSETAAHPEPTGPAVFESVLPNRPNGLNGAGRNGHAALTASPGSSKIIGTRLACVGGPYLGQSFPLTHQTAHIGRALDNAIALPADTTVSRVHARIVYEGGRHIICDFGSQNGVLVNDAPVVDPLTLKISDIVKVGATTLRYE